MRGRLAPATRAALKVAVAATVLVLVMAPFEPAPLTVGIGVVGVCVVMGDTVGGSLLLSANRIVASAVGIGFGVAVHFALGTDPGAAVWRVALGTALAVFAASVAGRLLRLKTGFRLGGALAGLMVVIPGEEVWSTAVGRLGATAVAVVVATVVGLVVFPDHARPRLRRELATLLDAIADLHDAAVRGYLAGTHRDERAAPTRVALQRGLAASVLLADEARLEPTFRPEIDRALAAALHSVRRLRSSVLQMHRTAVEGRADEAVRTLGPELLAVADASGARMRTLAGVLRDARSTPPSDAVLPVASAAFAAAVEARRGEGVFRALGTDEVARLYSFVFDVQAVAAELDALADVVGTATGGDRAGL